MSYQKLGNIFPIKTAAFLEQEIVARLNKILRDEYQDLSSTLKKISGKTGIRCDTIKRWYEGRNPPSSGHLIILALHHPSVLKMILDLSEYGYLIPHVLPDFKAKTTAPSTPAGAPPEIYSAENCTINLSIPPRIANRLNQRQLWFLGQLQQKEPVKAKDIVRQWRVAPRSAKADIAKMIRSQLIRFVGAKKTGWYEINI